MVLEIEIGMCSLGYIHNHIWGIFQAITQRGISAHFVERILPYLQHVWVMYVYYPRTQSFNKFYTPVPTRTGGRTVQPFYALPVILWVLYYFGIIPEPGISRWYLLYIYTFQELLWIL